MCDPGQQPRAAAPSSGVPRSAGDALDMVLAGLGWLASADVASLPTPVQAEVLRALERAGSVHAAAKAKVLAAFTAQGGYEDDGQGSPRAWLTWQTRVTSAAASAALASMRRLSAHPAIADALAEGHMSASWARQIAGWTDQLPEDARPEADVILLAAAAGGAELADLASLADQIRRRVARPDRDRDDGFDDRRLWLSTTLGGAGSLHGDLTPRCAAALRAVLESLGKKAGPADLRSKAQRDHDALEEALRRLIAAGCLPDRAGQPTQITLHMTLDDLLGRAGKTTARADADGAGHLAAINADGDQSDGSATGGRDDAGAGVPQPAWPGPAARLGDACDAQIVPIVTGRVDHDLLDRLAGQFATSLADHRPFSGRPAGSGPDASTPPGARVSRTGLRDIWLANAIALLSGPGGLASLLRTGTLPKPAASVSLPLDVGTATDTIPPHLRRAVIARDRRCAAPGCDQPSAACDVHHIIPRARGGPTSLINMVLLCRFHHLIMIHEWGWTISLHPDGATTMTSPDGRRQY